MFWFLHKFKFRRFSCIRKPNVKLKMYDAKTCILFLKKVHLSFMGTYFNNILLRKTLQVFIVWQKVWLNNTLLNVQKTLKILSFQWRWLHDDSSWRRIWFSDILIYTMIFWYTPYFKPFDCRIPASFDRVYCFLY